MKKIISMMMALAMVLALAIPAFATGGDDNQQQGNNNDQQQQNENQEEDTGPTFSEDNSGSAHTFTLTAHTETPTVKVYVPTSTSTDLLVLNPYALSYKFSQEEDAPSYQEQIITKPIYVGSNSNVPVLLSMNVKATTGGNAVLATKSVVADSKVTTNSVFIWGQVVDAGKNAAVPTTEPTLATAYDSSAGKSGNMILVAADVTRTGLYTFPASADITAAANNAWACVKFTGDAVKAPTTPWASGDTVKLDLTFTFTPSMNTAG
jgi:hypothetical protein